MRNDRRNLLLFVLFVLSIQFHPLFAGDPTLNTIVNPANVTYDPDSVSMSTGSITVKNNDWDTAFCVEFTAPETADGFMAYDLKKPANSPIYVLSKTGAAVSADEVLSGAFTISDKRNATKSLDYAIVAYPGFLPPPGTYSVTVVASLYKSSLPSASTFIQSRNMVFNIVVGDYFDVAIVPVDAPFSLTTTSAVLSFGYFQEGDSRFIDAVARSNISCTLALSSANGGFMHNTDPLDTSTVRYSFTVNGRALALPAGSSVPIANTAATTGISGERYNLGFTIEPFTELPGEGTYTDMLTLTLSAP